MYTQAANASTTQYITGLRTPMARRLRGPENHSHRDEAQPAPNQVTDHRSRHDEEPAGCIATGCEDHFAVVSSGASSPPVQVADHGRAGGGHCEHQLRKEL